MDDAPAAAAAGAGDRAAIHHYITAVCRNNGCPVVTIGGMPDHVHLLVYLSSGMTISRLMHLVKGGSSRLAGQLLGGDAAFAWQRGYGVFGVSPHDKERVAAYIRHQKRHHTDGAIWPGARNHR
jgi:REP element-mobilizing transposase RayT